MEKQYYVYLMTNYLNTTFYIGVTNNLLRRVYEHKTKQNKGFTERYNLNKLVYLELTSSIEDAIKREKQLKNWKKQWKIDLIKTQNPSFSDLSEEIGLNKDVIAGLQMEYKNISIDRFWIARKINARHSHYFSMLSEWRKL